MSKMRAKGFSLIELIIVVAVVGILAAIAYPSYQESSAKSKRRDAQAALLGLASAMERYYTQNNGTYADSADASTKPIAGLYPSQAPLDGSVKYYDLTITGEDADSYVLSAVPIPGGGMAGDRCGTMTLNEAGSRGDGDASDNCW